VVKGIQFEFLVEVRMWHAENELGMDFLAGMRRAMRKLEMGHTGS
jgi:hypothetical protein